MRHPLPPFADVSQTSKMIKFAVTRPEARLGDIDRGIQMLNWVQDPVHRAYGLEISSTMTEVSGLPVDAPVTRRSQAD